MKLTQQEKEAQKLIVEQIEKVLNELSKHYDTVSGISGLISVDYIKRSHKVFIDSYKKGIEDDTEGSNGEKSKDS